MSEIHDNHCECMECTCKQLGVETAIQRANRLEAENAALKKRVDELEARELKAKQIIVHRLCFRTGAKWEEVADKWLEEQEAK